MLPLQQDLLCDAPVYRFKYYYSIARFLKHEKDNEERLIAGLPQVDYQYTPLERDMYQNIMETIGEDIRNDAQLFKWYKCAYCNHNHLFDYDFIQNDSNLQPIVTQAFRDLDQEIKDRYGYP